MSMSVELIAGCALVTYLMKGIGPLALGGRDLPVWFTSVVMLMAPALFAALVATQALADGHHLAVGANTVGVAAGGFVAWRFRSVIGCVLVAAVVTAVLRAI
jgi:branched-subunit amino acid transport protein